MTYQSFSCKAFQFQMGNLFFRAYVILSGNILEMVLGDLLIQVACLCACKQLWIWKGCEYGTSPGIRIMKWTLFICSLFSCIHLGHTTWDFEVHMGSEIIQSSRLICASPHIVHWLFCIFWLVFVLQWFPFINISSNTWGHSFFYFSTIFFGRFQAPFLFSNH